MTAADIRALSPKGLQALYDSLSATELPVGTFAGRAWSETLPVEGWITALDIWTGKVFRGTQVRNIIFGHEAIEGACTLERTAAVIHYPLLGLDDFLKPISRSLWLGYMPFGAHTIWFTLEKKRSRR
jgi:hypothetical protein